VLKWVPVVSEERCTGCDLCIEACGPACLALVDGIAALNRPDHCGSEEHCIQACRDDAIEMRWVEITGDLTVGLWRTNA